MLDPLVRRDPACHGPVLKPGAGALPSDKIPETRTTTWVEPVHVVRGAVPRVDARRRAPPPGVSARADGQAAARLRAPGLAVRTGDRGTRGANASTGRTDDGAPARTIETPSAVEVPPPPRTTQKTVNISNPNKVFWPAEKYTKGDLIAYYRVDLDSGCCPTCGIGRSS